MSGYGEERGGITTVISNWCENERTVIFLQILPWYLRVYYHTLSFRNYFYSNSDGNGTRIRPGKLVNWKVFFSMKYLSSQASIWARKRSLKGLLTWSCSKVTTQVYHKNSFWDWESSFEMDGVSSGCSPRLLYKFSYFNFNRR